MTLIQVNTMLLIRTVKVSLVRLLVGAASTLTWADSAEALSLNIALEGSTGLGVTEPGEVFERVNTLLTARGHVVTVVSGAELDTLAEISAFDVVVLNGTGFTARVDWELFDAQVNHM